MKPMRGVPFLRMAAKSGLRNLALGELDSDGLDVMLAEGETLFVEHKRDIEKGQGFQLAKAAASFANTMGGWILIGVSDGSPDSSWSPPKGEFVDRVRQRLEGQLDPLPSFAARIFEHRSGKIGLVRVYESADTPHLLRDGSIVVREPAQDAKLRKRGQYEATPIRSHYELLQLAQRGERARAAAEARLRGGSHPLTESSLGLLFTGTPEGFKARSRMPTVALRLAPLTFGSRWREWATSSRTVENLTEVASGLVTASESTTNVLPYAAGFCVTATSNESKEWTPGASVRATESFRVGVDEDGVLGVAMSFALQQVSGRTYYHRSVEDGHPLTALLLPLLKGAARAVSSGEHFGRYAVHLDMVGMGELYRVQPENPSERLPRSFESAGGLTVGSDSDGAEELSELSGLCARWSGEFSRALGIPVWS